jgi:hypothetical protein
MKPTRDQREALKQSEKDAGKTHPDYFKDKENESKQVEVPPIQPEGQGMQGIDPDDE